MVFPRRRSTTPPFWTACEPAVGCCSSTGWATASRPSPTCTTPWPCRPTWPRPSWPNWASRSEGSWPVELTRRVVTNGSIYIEQAHLTNGQQLLLSLPDEKLPPEAPVNAASLTRSLRETYSPAVSLPPDGSPDDLLPATVEQIMHDDGHLVLTRLIRYIEERRQNEARFTGAIESDPSPLHIVWGMDDPIAVPSMVATLLAARPEASVVQLDGVGHYPMVEAPALFLAAVLPGLTD
jgi:pimeloyl-ACP methyl ester carboxylesterase